MTQRYPIHLDFDRGCCVMRSHGGHEILFDFEDLPRVSVYAWRIHKSHSDTLYVRSHLGGDSKSTVQLHRYILGVSDRDIHVDHINRNPLDNRRQNLRLVNQAQNAQNRKAYGRHSPFKGVTRDRDSWRVQLRAHGDIVLRANTQDETIAALLYDHFARLHHGEYAWPNFKDDSEIPPAYRPILEDIRAGRASRYARVFKCQTETDNSSEARKEELMHSA